MARKPNPELIDDGAPRLKGGGFPRSRRAAPASAPPRANGPRHEPAQHDQIEGAQRQRRRPGQVIIPF